MLATRGRKHLIPAPHSHLQVLLPPVNGVRKPVWKRSAFRKPWHSVATGDDDGDIPSLRPAGRTLKLSTRRDVSPFNLDVGMPLLEKVGYLNAKPLDKYCPRGDGHRSGQRRAAFGSLDTKSRSEEANENYAVS